MKEYKVVIYREPLLGSLFFGESKTNPVKFSALLNENAQQGWKVITMGHETRRELLFWKREGHIVVLERDKA